MYSFFNADHWLRVKKVRQAAGLNSLPETDRVRPNHRLAHATLHQVSTGIQWKVQVIREDWWLGRYLTAILEHNGSHRTCVVENFTCEAPDVIRLLGEFNSDFELVH